MSSRRPVVGVVVMRIKLIAKRLYSIFTIMVGTEPVQPPGKSAAPVSRQHRVTPGPDAGATDW